MKNIKITHYITFFVLTFFGIYGCNNSDIRGDKIKANQKKTADVIIIGAGISGLSAALEASKKGHSVLILDMASVFGGHAVVAAGVLNIPVTPAQEQRGIKDSHELAINDFTTWGEDTNKPWVNYYVKNAKTDIYDWLTGFGIDFFAVAQPAGNSVPRVHVPTGSGLNLITTIYRKVLEIENIEMIWNTRADDLIVQDGRITGVSTTHIRSGKKNDYYGSAIIIASGGFQSNLQRVLDNWPQGMNKPARILAGSGINSMGSGLDIAASVGAKIERLDHQWNYISGVPNPDFEEGNKGLSFFPFPGRPRYDIFLNDDGERFTNECQSPKFNLPKVLLQPSQRYWSVFDSKNKPNMTISGPGWTEERLQKEIYDNSDISHSANNIEELAKKMNVDVSTMKKSIFKYNTQIAEGLDQDFGRFGAVSEGVNGNCINPLALETPPYYAVRLLPLARKSLGGIKIDIDTHVLDVNDKPIPGLYAVGEVTGFAGINGKAGLEGTFLGPSIVTGRVAGRTVSAEVMAEITNIAIHKEPFTIHPKFNNQTECSSCHQLEKKIQEANPGYEHFGFVHKLVLEDKLPCQMCHSNLYPYNPIEHHWDIQMKTNSCVTCHGGGD